MTELWVRADRPDSPEERKELVVSALEAGIGTAVVRPEDSGFSGLGRMRLVTPDALTEADVSTPEGQEAAMALAGRDAVVVARTSDWTVIPLENLVAAFSGTPTRLFVEATDPSQAELFSGILEKGVDGILVDVPDPGSLSGFADAVPEEGLELSVLEVTDVRPIGMGDRVCVDTVSMMSPGEGMLVGSQSSCLFLVQSESEDNGYVAARPFRVNAGAVHAYVRVPGGRTRYLSEMRAGEPVEIVGRDGSSRTSAVGRCKVERRPLLMVSAVLDGREYTTVLQNAETVRMVCPGGSVPVSALKAGDRVLAYAEDGGRHFGMKVDETVREI